MSSRIARSTESGSQVWNAKVPGTPTTPPTVGGDYVFIGTDESTGRLHVLKASQAFSSDPVQPLLSQDMSAVARGGLGYASIAWSGSVSGTTVLPTVFYPGAPANLEVVRVKSFGGVPYQLESLPVTLSGDISLSSPLISGDQVFLGTTSGRVHRVDLVRTNGSFGAWSKSPSWSDTSAAVASPGTVPGLARDAAGRVVFANPYSLRALSSSTLNTEWEGTHGFAGASTAPVVSSSGRIYFGSAAKHVLGFTPPALSSDFDELISSGLQGFPTYQEHPVYVPPLVGVSVGNEQTVYVVAGDKRLRAYPEGSSPEWSVLLDAAVETSPVLDCSGIAYVATVNGTVHAIVTDSLGLSQSSWPKYQHDNGNTGNASQTIWSGLTCQD